MKKSTWLIALYLIALALPALASGQTVKTRPADLVDAGKLIPSLVLDMRYTTPHNFLGVKVKGYRAAKCLLTRKAAKALAQVQAELNAFGFSLKIYDCYRPQTAVNHFVAWAKKVDDTLTKAEFYPTVDKKNLFKDGYIAARSSHSRGSTVDLTIIALPARKQETYHPHQNLRACSLPAGRRFGDNSLDMGTGFDCFNVLSHPANPNLKPRARANRLLLKSLMEKHGFQNYDKEWWHFTLKHEPYPDTYYDFPVE